MKIMYRKYPLNGSQILERFKSYITIDTEAEYGHEQIPSTAKQFDLANKIKAELEAMGLSDVELDKNCYLYATLPSNVPHDVPAVGFVAHFDTSPDFTGKGVNPQVWEDYDGKDIVLNAAKNIVLKTADFPEIVQYKGQTIVTTDGNSLLGADDKAGVTEIVSAFEFLINNPDIKHGPLKLCFTPDEEIGRGADLFRVDRMGAEWAYTMDGSEIGELEYENFNAAFAKVVCKGVSVHPGSAKNKMVNAMTLAREFQNALPQNEVPECTEGYEGFFHLLEVKGSIEHCEMVYIVRDHDRNLFEERKQLMTSIFEKMQAKYGAEMIEMDMKDQYYNMKEKVEPMKYIVDYAAEAYEALNIKPIVKPIRGGTDGSRLSFMGLPCPNIFAGGHNFHGKFEYVPLESIISATEVIVELAQIIAQKSEK